MLSFLVDLVTDMFAGGDAQTRRTRALRRKLVRYLKAAPVSAFTGSAAAHVGPSGEIRGDARGQAVAIAKRIESQEIHEWEDLCARFLDRVDADMPGLQVQLPPDEPRMAYAGDKSL